MARNLVKRGEKPIHWNTIDYEINHDQNQNKEWTK